jgi:hypothetical protein
MVFYVLMLKTLNKSSQVFHDVVDMMKTKVSVKMSWILLEIYEIFSISITDTGKIRGPAVIDQGIPYSRTNQRAKLI